MVINGSDLLRLEPIKNMLDHKVQDPVASYGLVEAGYDIRIAQDIVFMGKFGNTRRRENADGTRTEDVFKGRFVLASAVEEFDMPNSIVGIVHDKSTWARKGLSVFNTVIEPGFKGGLTLELVYHGTEELHIPAGAGIAQVIFSELTQDAEYTGKYQNQSTNPEPARFS